jgi:hypothetical protein
MKLARSKSDALTLTLTVQELAALFAAARIALDALETDPHAPPGAIQLLGRMLHEYDGALKGLDAAYESGLWAPRANSGSSASS